MIPIAIYDIDKMTPSLSYMYVPIKSFLKRTIIKDYLNALLSKKKKNNIYWIDMCNFYKIANTYEEFKTYRYL